MSALMRLLAVAGVLGLAAGLCAEGGGTKEGGKERLPMVTGKVVKVDADAKTITVNVPKKGAEGTDMTFTYTDATKVILAAEKKQGKIEDVKADAHVGILYKEEGGKTVALSIRIMPAGAAPKAGG